MLNPFAVRTYPESLKTSVSMQMLLELAADEALVSESVAKARASCTVHMANQSGECQYKVFCL
jgi:hypothetical protein